MASTRVRTTVVVILLVFISALFVAMIRSFLVTLLLAAIFSALTQPLYRRLLDLLRGKRALASVMTLLVLLLIVVLPLLAFLGVLASQALSISQAAGPWIQKQIQEPDEFTQFLESLPGFDRLAPYKEEILSKLGQLVGFVGNFLVGGLSAATKLTVSFFFHLFLMLYSMFFFLTDGPAILRKILHYVPLGDEEEALMVDKFVSVSRATIKGTFIIGLVQGLLAGIAFAVAGIQGAVFWGTIMTVLSIIPGVGAAIVWFPAVVYLVVTGQVLTGVLLALFCGLVVGTADNFLRPRLVGRDVKMHELMILFSTLGGIVMFGVVGILLGPIIAALFVTIWEMYGVVSQDALPGTLEAGRGEGSNQKS